MSKLKRNFTQTSLISRHLICSICQDTFDEPNRIGCGHTFCDECIKQWLKSNSDCPMCRKKFAKSNISKDLVASNIINDLEVTCNYDHCPWKGPLSDLERHLQFCGFNPEKLSKEVKSILENEKKFEKEVGSSADQYLSFNTQSSLKARLYQKNPAVMENSLKKNEPKEISIFDLLDSKSTADKEMDKIQSTAESNNIFQEHSEEEGKNVKKRESESLNKEVKERNKKKLGQNRKKNNKNALSFFEGNR